MLKNAISVEEIKKIFPNKSIKSEYLSELALLTKTVEFDIKSEKDIDEAIVRSWNYDVSKTIIREMFRKTDKYSNGKNSAYELEELMNSWKRLNLGDLEWPFKAMAFDQHVHRINNSSLSETEKDEILSKEIVKFRRIKEINAKRNDYIEYLIFENCDDIIPTLAHRRGVDFYIHGYPFDQKVSRSVSKQFIEQYGENYRRIAIENPVSVAECLYKYQDEERFGAEPRLLVVYLDTDLSLSDIEKSFNKVNFNEPYKIKFEYKHSDNVVKTHETCCYIILLYNEEKSK